MKHLKHEVYMSSTWCAECREMIKPDDGAWRDHERHNAYCTKCAKAADHRIEVEVWNMRRRDVIKALERLKGEGATISLDQTSALLPDHPE